MITIDNDVLNQLDEEIMLYKDIFEISKEQLGLIRDNKHKGIDQLIYKKNLIINKIKRIDLTLVERINEYKYNDSKIITDRVDLLCRIIKSIEKLEDEARRLLSIDKKGIENKIKKIVQNKRLIEKYSANQVGNKPSIDTRL